MKSQPANPYLETVDEKSFAGTFLPGKTEADSQLGSYSAHPPLSFAQKRLWVLSQFHPGLNAYHIPVAVRVKGPIDYESLESAVTQLVERHTVLRATFPVENGQLTQLITSCRPIQMAIEEVPNDHAQKEAIIQKFLMAPFDLAAGPLFRLKLLRIHETDHTLLFVVHHLLFDLGSIGILTNDLCALYQANRLGMSDPLPPLKMQYGDFARRELEDWKGGRLDSQLRYWKQKLNSLTPLSLPTDKRRPEIQSFRGAWYPLTLNEQLSRQLVAFNKHFSLTMFMTLLGAFQILLYRYSNEPDIAVGIPISGRNDADLEPVLGLFVNTLVIRSKFEPHETVSHFMRRLRETCLEAYSHQELPFDKIVEELKPERDISRNPLFQALFTLNNVMPSSSGGAGDLGLTLEPLETRVSKFDMTLSLEEDGATLWGGFEYNTDLFESGTIKRIAGHFLALVQQIAGNPEEKILDLHLLSGDESRTIITEWNRTDIEHSSLLLHELFESQASSTPEALAVKCEDQTLSYDELNRFANQISHKLAKLGVGAEAIVAVSMQRSVEMVATLLAILKCGAAYLPLDPELPPARTQEIIESADPKVVLTQASVALSGLPDSPNLFRVSQESVATESADNLHRTIADEQAIYVIYTSGSTGKPKGVVNQHRGLSNRIQWMQRVFALSPTDRVLQKTPYFFDVSVWELFWPLCAGATMVMAKPGGHRDPEYLGALIQSEQVTVVHFVPSMLDAFAEAGQLAACGGVRFLFSSGEALNMPTLLKVKSALPAEIYNLYGPTEAAVDVSFWCCSCKDQARLSVPIGKPISNTQLYVLDGAHRPVPVGVTGKLYIGGANVARGYLKEPALTAQKFVPDPFSLRPGSRLYDTGDLARYSEDGTIEYEGRSDQQIKIRGFRVEPGEIETRLQSHDRIRDAVVVPRSQQNGPPLLLAYLTKQECDQIVFDNDVKAYLRTHLPEHMIPAQIIWLDTLPLTTSGKLDRRALSQLPAVEPSRESFCPPATDREQALVSILGTILPTQQQIGVRDNLFELGCDSIRCIQLAARAQEHGITFSLQDIFRNPTIESLSRVGQSETIQFGKEQSIPFDLIDEKAKERFLGSGDIVDAYPLTQLQQGMLYHTEYSNGSGTYHDVVSLRLRLNYDERSLRQALYRIALQHDVLRTSFDLVNFSPPLQIVHASVAVPLTVTDLRLLHPNQREQRLQQWLNDEKCSTFTWNVPPLYRVHVHLLDEGEIQFTLSFHHAIMDGWSVATFLSRVLETYHQLVQGPLPHESSLRTSFRDAVQSELKATESAEVINFWRQSLDGAESVRTRWLTSVVSWGREITNLRSVVMSFPDDICHHLHRIAHEANVPLKSVLLAVHARVVAAFYAVNDIVTGLATNNRPQTVDSEKVLGLFVNVVPFPVRLRGGTWESLIREVFAAELGLLPFQSYPGTLVERSVGQGPLFEWIFNYVHFHVYGTVAAQSGPAFVEGEFFEKTNYPLATTFSSGIGDKSLGLTFSYDAAQISESRAGAIAAAYRMALEEVSHSSNVRYDAHDYMPVAERQRLRTRWNFPSEQSIEASTIDRMFVERAHKEPDTIAVTCGTRSVTYGELEKASALLASYLVSRGVGPEVRVGVCLGRSVETVMAFLAVVRAGGAYVPLDPEYPLDRLELMLRDSSARVLVTKGRLMARHSGFDGVTIRLDRDSEIIERQDRDAAFPGNILESTAYVIYTSGSTGKPKGVVVPHRGIANIVAAYLGFRGRASQEKVLQYSSPSFDGGICEMVITLLPGGTLCIPPPGPVMQGQELAAFLQQLEITCAILPPAVLSELPQTSLMHLKTLGSAGEACPPCLPAVWSSDRHFVNVYGPTETTIFATIATVDPADDPVPIGYPIANVQVFLLDEFLLPAPMGTAGEVYIGGPGLATCYVNSPALTAERFLPNPFSQAPGARMYRTSDLARYREDGQIDYVGRSDQQLKVRGYRIEPGEIERALMMHPGVRFAVVQARGQAPSDRSIVAYLEANSATFPSTDELRSFLSKSLPAYLIPNSFIWIDSVPKNINGKIEYERLGDLEPVRLAEKRTFAGPQSSMELLVADIWKSVLEIDEVGVDDNFLSLGGHSLRFLQVQKRLYAGTQQQVPIRELYTHLTLRELARHLEEYGRQSASLPPTRSPLVPLNVQGCDAKFFCVHPLGGGVATFSELARLLTGICDFYAFQALDLETAGASAGDHESIEQFAQAYVSHVIETDPDGPYMLGGLSFGGVVAFEIARQLESLGKHVSLLALLDSRGPGWKMPDVSDEELLVGFAREHAAAAGAEISLSITDIRGMDLASAMRFVDGQLASAGLRTLNLDLSSIKHFLQGVHKRIAMAQRYAPAVYMGELTVFHAQDRDPLLQTFYNDEDPLYGWGGSSATPVRVIDVPGNHATFCAQPNVRFLAQRLTERITAARSHALQ